MEKYKVYIVDDHEMFIDGLKALLSTRKDIEIIGSSLSALEALKVLKQNISLTDPNRCEVFGGDSFANINTITNILKRKNQDAYFYIDPPFSIREGMEDIYDKTINLISNLPKECVKLIIIEHMSGLDLPNNINGYELQKSKKFGNTALSYYL